jgi:hypothetical protein
MAFFELFVRRGVHLFFHVIFDVSDFESEKKLFFWVLRIAEIASQTCVFSEMCCFELMTN